MYTYRFTRGEVVQTSKKLTAKRIAHLFKVRLTLAQHLLERATIKVSNGR